MPIGEIKMPPPPKRFERQFSEAMVFMIEQIAQRFKNQTLLNLTKKSLEKFEDAKQVGNSSRVFLTMANRVKRKLKKQFTNGRIENVSNDIMSRSNRFNQDRIYASASPSLGIEPVALIAKEGLTPQINALMLETSQWAKKLRDDTLEHFTANTLRGMALGKSIEEIISEFDAEALKVKSKARFIARNQIANFNGISSKIRAQKLGVKKAIWVTARDERVRSCHMVRDGKEYEISEGLFSSCDNKTLIPGQDFQCRCIARFILPEENN
ncbi:minor capsid protein [Candidatus Pacearchaeota archaeon]|nr:minor capsid protein [Candidatus Pacearchaeota archaeon]